MKNEPVPTAGHWNIMDIYSPAKRSTTSPPAAEATLVDQGGASSMAQEFSLAHLTVLGCPPAR